MQVPSGLHRIRKSKQYNSTNQPLACSLCNILLICASPWELNYKGAINVPSKRNKVSSKSIYPCYCIFREYYGITWSAFLLSQTSMSVVIFVGIRLDLQRTETYFILQACK